MVIAIPSNDGTTVEEHFGHCRQFVMVTVEEGKEVARTSLTPPEHAPGVFPAFLGGKGVNTVITGGMGGRAVELFKQQNIDVILGASGLIDTVLNVFLEGELASTGSICAHHGGDC